MPETKPAHPDGPVTTPSKPTVSPVKFGDRGFGFDVKAVDKVGLGGAFIPGKHGERGTAFVVKAPEKIGVAATVNPDKFGVTITGDAIKLPTAPKAWEAASSARSDSGMHKFAATGEQKSAPADTLFEVHKIFGRMADDGAANKALPKVASEQAANTVTDHLSFVDGHAPFSLVLHG